MSGATVAKDWTTAAGLRAVVLMTSMGHHCGYVAVPAGHVLHGCEYSAPHAALSTPDDDEPLGKRSPIAVMCAALDASRLQAPDMVFNVHGGLTYSGGSATYPAVSDDAPWWFGYDCAHLGDSPKPASSDAEDSYFYGSGGEFRDLDYCAAECESLARQIVEKTGGAA